ncbi:MAG: RHS repeat-associated core domain-containing protein [Bacillota bacterium]
MKHISKILLVLSLLIIFIPFQVAYAETLEEQLNNLVGPKQQYNTMLSPVYLRSNLTEEYISPQSGELTLTQTDYVLPGRNGLDLEIKRIYKSGISNVQEMKVKYVHGAWVDYVHSDVNTSSFYEDRYNLGIGMRFSFPAMEIRSNDEGTSHKFLHTESGDVYRLKSILKDGVQTYFPEGQTIKDVSVSETTEYSNGQSDGTSKYVMVGKNGKKTYFSEDGRVLGIVDRYGNTIKFEYTAVAYTIDGVTVNKNLLSKITDSVGRTVTMEYKQDQTFTVGSIVNQQYSKEESYKATQNPNNVDSGDLKEKFQVIVNLPGGKKLVYDKSAVLVSESKHVIRTRLQRVFDVDNKPKYHFWYEQPDLGFTYVNGTTYSVYNRYENLTMIDYCKTNEIKQYVYNTYTKRLNKGSMQYRKIFEKKDLIKKDYDIAQADFPGRFITEVKNKANYVYTNEADGFGFDGYNEYSYDYLKSTYRYYTEIKDINDNSTKYTYDGIHQLLQTEESGKDHKEIITSEHDEMKLVKKKERVIYNVENGQETGTSYKKIQNFRYDEYGNLTNYTGPEAERDENGYPVDNEHTVVYSYAYDKYHVPLSKTWKQDKDTTGQIIYTLDDKGNITKETKTNSADNGQWIVTDFQYDEYGNIRKKEVHSGNQSFVTNYEYGVDADGTDHKGAYLTKEYRYVDDTEIANKYSYDFNTGNMKAAIDPNGNRTNYEFDVLGRVTKITRPENNIKEYAYEETPYANRKIKYTDPGKTVYQTEYDISGDLVKSSVFDNGKWNVLKDITNDAHGNKTKEIVPNGHSIRYEYDSRGRLISKTAYEKDSILKGSMKIRYVSGVDSDTPLVVTITDEEGYEKKYFYDSLNRLTKTEFTPDKTNYITTTYTYDYVGNKVTFTDGKNHTSSFAYDNLGRLIRKTDPLGNETQYMYNSLNQIEMIKEPEGRITEYAYDSLGRLSQKKIYKDGSQDYVYTKYTYDPADNVTNLKQGSMTSSGDRIASDTTYVYNQMNYLTDEYKKIDEARTSHINNQYDLNGNKVQIMEYANQDKTKYRIFNYVYDFAGRIKEERGSYRELNGQGGYVEYGSYHKKSVWDYAGNLTKTEVLNTNGYDTTTYAYDYRNKLIEKVEPYTSNEVKKRTSYRYDKVGNLLNETILKQGESCTSVYTYDGLGRILTKTDALGNTARYAYDETGNLAKEVDARYLQTSFAAAPGIEYAYDELNRLIKTIAFDGTNREVIGYKEYDSRGNVTKEADGEGYNAGAPSASIGNVYEYDALNRVSKYISAQTFADNQKNGGNLFNKKYTYDGMGNVLIEEDGLGNKIQNVYYMNGLLKEKLYADGKKEHYDYDLTGKMMVIKTDRAGNATKLYQTIFGEPYRIEYPDGTFETFTYSSKGKLVEYRNQEGNVKYYGYDPSGNQLYKKEYIKSDIAFTYYRLVKNSYDEINNLLSSETFLVKTPKLVTIGETTTSAGDRIVYTYDKAGKLTKITGPMGRETVQEYDKAGNPITKKQKVEGEYYDVVRYDYDFRSRLISESTLVKTADLDNKYLVGAKYDKAYFDRVLSTVSYEYYKNRQLKTKKDPQGNVTQYEYDYSNRLVKKIDPLQTVVTYQYDLNGNLIEEKNAKNAVISYEYDEFNRLIRKKAPAADGSTAVTRYIYDVMGNLIKEISPNHYDASKDTPSLVDTMIGISYAYDVMNRRISTSSPEDELIEYIEYNQVGRIQKVIDGLRYTGDAAASKGTTYHYDSLGRVLKMTDALGYSMNYEYDVLDNLTKKIDARNNATIYTYNPDKTLAKVTYADNGTIAYTYDGMGRKTSQKDQLGNLTFIAYNGFGKEKEIKDPYDNTVASKYDLSGNLVALKDKRGNIVLFSYDANNRLIEKKTPLALDGSKNVIYAVETYLYDEAGNLVRKTATDSKDKLFIRVTSYTYYDNNLLSTVSDSSGRYIRNHYDKNGNIIKTESLRDKDTYDIEKFEYDHSNRLTKRIQLVDEDDIYQAGSLTNLKDNEYPGKIQLITGYAYDILGNKVKEIHPKAYAYSETDIENREKYAITFTYDIRNRLEKIIRKINGVDVSRQFGYDGVGNKISEKNERNYETVYTYDPMNRIKTITDPKKNIFTYQYDAAGNEIAETNAKGHTMTYGYDKLNRLVTITDPNGVIITKNIYDENGNVIKQIDAKGYLSGGDDDQRYGTLYTYDLANRLVKIVDPEIAALNDSRKFTVEYQYNPFGQRIQETDALGHTKLYEYDNAGRLVKVTDQLGISTSFGYNPAGNKLYMVDGRGKITKYTYGAFGMLKTVTNADEKTVQYQYDIGKNLASMIDRNGYETLYTYDNRDLLLSKSVEETGDSISYTYDEAGSRASMADESGKSLYTYDENNQLLEIKKDGVLQIRYTYDPIGNIATVTDKKGATTAYTYDKSSRMETVSYKGKTTKYSYDENGNRKAIEYHGGVSEAYVYDKNNRLKNLTNKGAGGNIISSYSYTHDLNGRQTTKTDSFGTTTYTYDPAGRVLSVEAPGKTTVYAYDHAGNRQSMSETYTSDQPSGYIDQATKLPVQYILKKTEYIYANTNTIRKLVETMYDQEGKEVLEKTVAYLYDDNGNELRQNTSYIRPHTTKMRQANGANPYGDTIIGDISTLIEKVNNTFDGFNQLKKIEKIKGGERVTVEYTYNGDGLRTQKITKSLKDGYKPKVTNYLYDRQHVILETDQNNSVIAAYIRGINYIGRYDSSNRLSYYLYNAHGDVVQTVSESGAVENQYDYDIFGNPTLTIQSYSNAIRYAGEFMDEETGLYYLRARYYDPYVGRFISEDSYWGEDTNPLSLNLYVYANNDPIQFVDPTGHWSGSVADAGGWDAFEKHIAEDCGYGSDDDDDDDRDSGGSSSRRDRDRDRDRSSSRNRDSDSDDIDYSKAVWNRFGEVIGFTDGESYVDYSDEATSTHGGWDPEDNEIIKNFQKQRSQSDHDDDYDSDFVTVREVIANKEKYVDIFISPSETAAMNAANEINRMLTYDSSLTYNEEVALMQKRLNELGYRDSNGRPLLVDGKFYKNTLAAVNAYKNQNGLWNTGQYAGVVGNTTWDHLFSDKAARAIIKEAIDNTTNNTVNNTYSNMSNSVKDKFLEGAGYEVVGTSKGTLSISQTDLDTLVVLERLYSQYKAQNNKSGMDATVRAIHEIQQQNEMELREYSFASEDITTTVSIIKANTFTLDDIHKLHKTNDKMAFVAGATPGTGPVMGPLYSLVNDIEQNGEASISSNLKNVALAALGAKHTKTGIAAAAVDTKYSLGQDKPDTYNRDGITIQENDTYILLQTKTNQGLDVASIEAYVRGGEIMSYEQSGPYSSRSNPSYDRIIIDKWKEKGYK